nr:hypothetical protein [uncultured Porphyromonas sp.]
MKLKKGCSEEMRKALVMSAFLVWAMLVSKLLLTDAEVAKMWRRTVALVISPSVPSPSALMARRRANKKHCAS